MKNLYPVLYQTHNHNLHIPFSIFFQQGSV